MAALSTVFVALILSLLITRVATVALTATGLARESARFQARSAFTGVGFTTSETENVVSHPVRRRIILLLMLLGNVGLVAIAASLLLSFTSADPGERQARLLLLIGGLGVSWWLAKSEAVDRVLTRLISRGLRRWTDVEVRDYANLLQLAGDYGVSELEVQRDDWVADRTLEELRLREEGIAILGVRRADGRFIGVPKGATRILPGDTLILYGRTAALAELDSRETGQEGDQAHARAVERQQE